MYRKIDGSIAAYPKDCAQDHLIPDDAVLMTDDELSEHLSKFNTPSSYDQLRKLEYPPITDYLDAIVKGDSIQLQKYIDDCLAVKAKYPK